MRYTDTITLIALPEIARRAHACVTTARRCFEANNVQPDALHVVSGRKPAIPLYVEPRASQLVKLLSTEHTTHC